MIIVRIVLIVGGLLLPTDTTAEVLELRVEPRNLAVYANPGGYGDTFVLDFDLPDVLSNSTIYSAVLELTADVNVRDRSGYRAETALLEVRVLSADFGGATENASTVGIDTMVRNIRLGSSRAVMMDITDGIRYYVTDQTPRYGLLVGALSGGRDGVFQFRTASNGSLGRLIVRFEKP